MPWALTELQSSADNRLRAPEEPSVRCCHAASLQAFAKKGAWLWLHADAKAQITAQISIETVALASVQGRETAPRCEQPSPAPCSYQ
jgi:hypothetical protein